VPIPQQGTKVAFSTTENGTYADIPGVISATLPPVETPTVPTHDLGSTFETKRASNLVRGGEAPFTIQLDPNNTVHQSLFTMQFSQSTPRWFKWTYNDGLTTNAFVKCQAIVTSIEHSEIERDDEENVLVDVNLEIASVPIRTAGTP
jgi:hypothetical protein